MGCFLACFGGAKERRRRKSTPIRRIPSRERLHERCRLLQPRSPPPAQPRQLGGPPPKLPQDPPLPHPGLRDATEEWNSAPKQLPEEKPPSPVPELRDRVEKPSFSSPRKKVTFDLNVKTYEQDPVHDNEVYSSQEAAEKEKKGEEEQKPQKGGNSNPLGSGTRTLNHRYQNCTIGDDGNIEEDEEDDYEYIDDDVDDDDNDDDGEDDDFEDCLFDDKKCTMDNSGNEEEESYDSYFSLPLEKEKQAFTEVSSAAKPIACASPDQQAALAAGQAARDRSHYVHSVLNPVENLLQWKEVKAKAQPLKHPKKENIDVEEGSEMSFSLQPSFALPRLQKTSESTSSPNIHAKHEVSVDASLSNWLPSSETTPVEGSKGNNSCRTNSSVSLDDRPILGALTIEDLKKHSMSSSSPRRSPSRSPDEIPILGTVGSYWSCTKGDTDSGSSQRSTSNSKGIPNTTSKYSEDKRVNWHSTPFQVRLERALNRGDADAYSSFPLGDVEV